MFRSRHIIPLALLTVLVLGALGGYFYFHSVIKDTIQSTADAMTEISNEQLSQSNIFALKKTIKETEADRDTLQSYFVKEDEVVKFIESIEDLGKKTNTIVQITQAQASQDPKKASTLFISLSSSGTFVDVTHFLVLLENLPHDMSVNKVLLSVETTPEQTVVDPKTGKIVSSKPGTKSWAADVDINLLSYQPK